ncbi:hypothetical protein, partial [Rhizobium sp. 9140]|uniref:hypothetical protein n=1 Tax=Rhizobium sp. 9140 TaxID=1761900 RepID=UPI00079C73A5
MKSMPPASRHALRAGRHRLRTPCQADTARLLDEENAAGRCLEEGSVCCWYGNSALRAPIRLMTAS